ncbi:MAG: carboxypeptidase regulatory-like domain-containing protein, partial [Vicinamibacterales bacterium]
MTNHLWARAATARRIVGLIVFAASCLTGSVTLAALQPTTTLTVEVFSDDRPVAGAEVSAGTEAGIADSRGRVTLSVGPGPVSVVVSAPGLGASTREIVVRADGSTLVRVELEPLLALEEEVVVTAT